MAGAGGSASPDFTGVTLGVEFDAAPAGTPAVAFGAIRQGGQSVETTAGE